MLDQQPMLDHPASAHTSGLPWPTSASGNWQAVMCHADVSEDLRDFVSYAALEGNLAWRTTNLGERASLTGPKKRLPHSSALRHRWRPPHRVRHHHIHKWFKKDHEIDDGFGLGQNILPPKTPYVTKTSIQLQAEPDKLVGLHGKFRLQCARAGAISDISKYHFDGILMYSHLEHKADGMGILAEAHQAPKDIGANFIRVPNFSALSRRVNRARSRCVRHPDHATYYTLAPLRDTCARAGFETTLINRPSLTVDDTITVLLHKRTLT